MFGKNKKLNQILDIMQEILAKQQECKNGIKRIERKVEALKLPVAKNKQHEKDSEEIKKDIKEVKTKVKKKKLNFEKKTNVEGIAMNPKAKTRDFPIEHGFKNKSDLTVADFAKVLKVPQSTLNGRIWKLEHDDSIKWTSNDNFIYYIRRPNENYLTKVLTKPAQEIMLRRYGYGVKSCGRKRKVS